MIRNSTMVVLALLLGSCAKEQRPEASASVYEVEMEYHVSGTSEYGHIEPGQTHPDDASLIMAARFVKSWGGSATAVSSDGDLLTSRHVVDIFWMHSELCAGVWIDPGVGELLSDARIAWAELTVTGPDGYRWYGYGYAPVDDGFPCDVESIPRIEWHPSSSATVDMVDALTDLALIHIEATGVPYLTLDTRKPDMGTELVAVGVPRGEETILTGDVMNPCVLKTDTRILASLIPFSTMPMLEMSLELEHGMSGGPTADGTRLLGINAQIDSVHHRSYSVSGPYAAYWYDWVRGRTDERPLPVCHL